jgi:hypothetical protein
MTKKVSGGPVMRDYWVKGGSIRHNNQAHCPNSGADAMRGTRCWWASLHTSGRRENRRLSASSQMHVGQQYSVLVRRQNRSAHKRLTLFEEANFTDDFGSWSQAMRRIVRGP